MPTPQDVVSWSDAMAKAGGWGVAFLLALVVIVLAKKLFQALADHKVELKAAHDEANKVVEASHAKVVHLLEQQIEILNNLRGK